MFWHPWILWMSLFQYLLTLLNRVENPVNRRRSTVLARLNISAVESKFFLHPFTCLAKNTEGISTAYIQLIHPGKQESRLLEMQFCFPMVRYHDLEVCHAISSAHDALRFLLTWGLPFTLLLRWTVSSVKFFCPTFLLLTHLSAPKDKVLGPQLCISISILLSFLYMIVSSMIMQTIANHSISRAS